MSFKYINKIPSPEEIISDIPLSSELIDLKSKRDSEIKKIFEGTSNKFLLVIGPCSADFEDSVCEYVSKLSKVQEKVKDKIVIIPRIYTNKPRTTGEGYKGMMHQPNLKEKPNVTEGIKSISEIKGIARI